MLSCDVHSRLDKVLKFKISIFFNNCLYNSFNKNFGSVSSDLLGNFFSNHVIWFLTPTCAKVGFQVGVVLHPGPIPNHKAGLIESVKTVPNAIQLAVYVLWPTEKTRQRIV